MGLWGLEMFLTEMPVSWEAPAELPELPRMRKFWIPNFEKHIDLGTKELCVQWVLWPVITPQGAGPASSCYRWGTGGWERVRNSPEVTKHRGPLCALHRPLYLPLPHLNVWRLRFIERDTSTTHPPLLGQGTINDLPKLYAKFLCNEDTRAENSLNIQLTTMQTGPQLNISCFHKFTSSTKLWFKPKTANLSKWWWKTVSRKLGD